jgi:NAD-dependent dihydropyrimidine dehydrogenase PreA subunit
MAKITIDEEACIGCAACVEICPNNILYMDEDTGKCKVSDPDKCDKAKGCEAVCPNLAIIVE